LVDIRFPPPSADSPAGKAREATARPDVGRDEDFGRDDFGRADVGREDFGRDDETREPESRMSPWTRRWLRRGHRALPTIFLVLWCVLAGIPTAILLTPPQQVTVAGQHVSVDAHLPGFTLSGPPQLVQIGNTALDITSLRVWGPLRPRLTLGPVQRNADAAAAINPQSAGDVKRAAVTDLGTAMLHWYLWAGLILLAFTLASSIIAGYIRMFGALRRVSDKRRPRTVSVSELWQGNFRQVRTMTVVAVVFALLSWAGSGALAFTGAADGLRQVRSLTELVGTYHLSPSPVGPKVHGYAGAVIGDSRAARVGGPALPNATEDDTACGRSADSLAVEIGGLTGDNVLNLACSGASIAGGLSGPQMQGGRSIPPQIGRLKAVDGLKYVVVVIGPNDLSWTDLLTYCYAVGDCSDRLTQGEFEYRLAALDRDYGTLLQDLNDLSDHPQIIVVTSYDVFGSDSSCPAAQATAGRTISPGNVRLLEARNAELNAVLRAGAEKYHFTVASPRLDPLCTKSADGLGADLQGFTDPQPFHPTGLGVLRMAAAVTAAIKPAK
jgi:lysophospholipase L1-like esterase